VKLLQGIQIGLTLLVLLVVLVFLPPKSPEAVGTNSPARAQGDSRKAAQNADPVKAHLFVLRGAKPGWEYPVYEGVNILGRSDEKPADIDLDALEAGPERTWSSRQHAAITCEGDKLSIEDLKSANGTYVNRERVRPGQKRALQAADVIQIGEIQFKVTVP
jgi:FHA domain